MPHDDETPYLVHPEDVVSGDGFSRRQMMAFLGTGAVFGLAGCSSQDGGDGGATPTSGGDGGDGGQVIDNTFTTGQQVESDKMQWNQYNPKRVAQGKEPIEGAIWAPLVKRFAVEDKWLSDLADSWEFKQGESFTITLREGLTWFNGMEVTADDLLTQHRLDKAVYGENTSHWSFTEEIVKEDKLTLRYVLSGEVNPDIFINQAFGQDQLWTRRDLYEEYINGIEAAESQEEVDAVVQDLIEWAPEEPFGCGMWKPTEISADRMVAELHEGHWASDLVNFTQYEWIPTFWQRRPEVQQQALIDGGLDGTVRVVNATESLLNQIPGDPIFPLTPTFNGFGITINHDREPYGDYRVRQALQHLINFQLMADQAVSMEHVKDTRYTGLSKYYVDNYVSEELRGNLIDYTEQNPDRAEQLLKDAGFSKSGGRWQTPNGKEFTTNILTVSGRVPWAQVAKNNFEDFGIPTKINTQEASTFFGVTVPNGEYGLALWTSGGWRQPFPFSDYNMTWNPDASPWAKGTNANPNPEVPWPPGNPEGDTQEIDLMGKIEELGRASGDQEAQLVDELAWIFNVTAPSIKLTERHFVSMIRTDKWDVPPEDDPRHTILTPIHYLPKLGEMNAKTE